MNQPAPATGLSIRRVPIDSLKLDPSNARSHGERNLEAIAASLQRFGQTEPLVVQRSSQRVIGGNGRLVTMRKLGWTECDIVEVDVDDLQATSLAIALNRTAELAEWNSDTLAQLLEQLRTEDSLEGIGFTSGEVDQLLAKIGRDRRGELDDPGPGEPPEEPVAKLGDLWILGDHRLLCGDSTKLEEVQRVMEGERAALAATDPPYLVDYTGARPNDSGKDWTDKYREIDIKDGEGFFRSVFTNVKAVLAPNAAIYCWHAHKRCGLIQRIWEDLGIVDHQQIVWVKPAAVFGRVFWHFRHEPCMLGWIQGSKPEHDGKHEFDSVWEIDFGNGKARQASDHPCLHPDSLVLTEAGWRPIQSIQVGDRVLAADGRFHGVDHVSSHRYGSPDLFRIVARGSNIPTLASDNHPFLVWRPERKKGRLVDGKVRWLRADELRTGDYTMTPVLAPEEVDPLPERDEEYWFLFGLYLAQGHLQRAGHGDHRYPAFSLHKKRGDLVARIRERWSNVGDYDPNDYGNPPSQGLTVMAFDASAGSEFEVLGGRLSHAKRIAPIVFELPRAKRHAVLMGWLNGDGCKVHDRTYWQGKTVSGDLAAHLALLAESVGYRTSVFRYEPPAVLGQIQGRQILSQRPEYHLYFYERTTPGEPRAQSPYLFHDGHEYQLRRIKSIERIPYRGDVWNLSVDGCASFQTSVGMSHNTAKPVEIFARPMRKHTQPGDLCFEPFSGSGSQIMAGEQLGRRVRAIEISPAFVDVAVQRWERATGRTAERA